MSEEIKIDQIKVTKLEILELSKAGAEGLIYLAKKTPNNKAKIEMKRHANAILELVKVVQRLVDEDLDQKN